MTLKIHIIPYDVLLLNLDFGVCHRKGKYSICEIFAVNGKLRKLRQFPVYDSISANRFFLEKTFGKLPFYSYFLK
jgi:hypothetical protein